MRQKIKRVTRIEWLILGAGLALLGACATGPSEPPAGSAQSSAEGSSQAATDAAAGADAEEVVVTGARVRRDDFSSPSATTVVTSDDMRNLGVTSVAEMIERLPQAPSERAEVAEAADGPWPSDVTIDNLRGINGFAGTRTLTMTGAQSSASTPAASPLSRATPGEEIWVIHRAQPAAQTEIDRDESPGTGALVANVPRGEQVPDGEPERGPEAENVPLPLEHTAVHAAVIGYVGTVDVTQQFVNPFDETIEAVYLFPLPEKAAVSEFVMTIGDRRIRGILREREEAEQIYAEARAQGYRASLLTQHRPNIFEQKVANIEPGKQIDVNIRYFHSLAYRDGWYSFVFPTVVGPRYNPPGSTDPVAALPRSDVQPTESAAVRYLRPDERSGHDLSITVDLDAGVAIEEIEASHPIRETRLSGNALRIELANESMLPNKDFVLDFRVAGDTIKSSLLTYRDPETGEGYFTLMMYPPGELERLERQALELVFVLDASGSMSGRPIEQAKQAILAALDRLEPEDTFQIIRFSTDASQLGSEPLPATPENIAAARRYVAELRGQGGTQMIEGIKAALDFPHDPRRLRFVTFLTDGYIGNEADILAEIDARLGASRIFSFGVGSSVNRYLIERMAAAGRGAVAYLGLNDSGSDVMGFFFDRISHPALIDVEIDWGDMRVAELYPSRVPDLFVGRPAFLTGRFSGEPGSPQVRGHAGGAAVGFELAYAASRPGASFDLDFLPQLWARLKIADLADRAVSGDPGNDLAGAIRSTALAYGLMSDYTAFIAVDASESTQSPYGTTVYQAVPVPEGVRYETTVQP